MSEMLKKEYNSKKEKIRARLEDFKKVWGMTDERLFSELCFCLCTPQSRAVYCDRAINTLVENRGLFSGDFDMIRRGLTAVRFPNNKTKFIIHTRELMTDGTGKIRVKDKIDPRNIFYTREWLVKNVKGLGWKEASHFLRNIGFGDDLAILDVHILKNMRKYRVIDELPAAISKKDYFVLEERLREFSRKISIPMGELDLLFWSSETGKIFK
ncbi:MAG: N-glycosylase/DNA lyase [Candidatus Omnitrophota bacterium]